MFYNFITFNDCAVLKELADILEIVVHVSKSPYDIV